VIGHDAHAVGVGHRRATELLNDESHDRKGYRLRLLTSPTSHPLLSFAVTNEKRQRQKELRHQKVDELARLERKEMLRQRVLLVVLVGVLFGGAIYLLTRGDEADPAAGAQADAQAQAEALIEQVGQFVPPPSGATITGDTPCPAEDGTSERTTAFENPPPLCIDPAADYRAVISTDVGDITVDLDAANAPQTVNNFVVLARYGYYEDVPFHRIIPGFVIQGGDAVGGGDPANPTLGAGNPGYAIDDELPAEGAYQIGSLAMANSGPDTNGSQFFIITGDNGASLPPLYSLFGTVTAGQDVVTRLDSIGTSGQGIPTEVVAIRSVTISEG
jgi:cyclophilin family peptidyl-prolyl cis-trans isomerase